VKAIEAGLLTGGLSYSPTPSQPYDGQWLVQLAFVPDHSGASVRDLHPLPVSSTSIARKRMWQRCIIWHRTCQAQFSRILTRGSDVIEIVCMDRR
jgi:hypothetical protein